MGHAERKPVLFSISPVSLLPVNVYSRPPAVTSHINLSFPTLHSMSTIHIPSADVLNREHVQNWKEFCICHTILMYLKGKNS